MSNSDVCDTISSWVVPAPDAPAVLGIDPMTRAELDRAARRLADRLRGAGVRADDLVGVLLPRGSGLVAALLGVLRSGGGYLPLDGTAAPGRLARLAEAVGLRWVITDPGLRATAEAMPGVTVLVADAPGVEYESAGTGPAAGYHPQDLAYTVFTSGSTGEPKPVAVPRLALANHAAALVEAYRLDERDRVLQFANPVFDVFAEEVFPTLAAGAAVVVLPDALPTPADLEAHLREQQVSVVNLPTPYWTHWTRDLDARPRALPPSLRLVVIGSEAGYAATLESWRRHSDVPVINAYGLSETTVTVTTARFEPGTAVADPLPIGRAVSGGVVHVLDDRMQPVPPGEPGELYIGGQVLARGYLGRADLTAERFVPDPVEPGGRLYRTGDLVRQLPEGLQFLGRNDDQLKIRGHRVEPLEVAAALTRHPDVLQAHVEPVAGDGQVQLVAYLVPRDTRRVPTAAAITRHAREQLPDYMVPAAFAVVDALPCLPTGKVDRAALPPVQLARRQRGDHLAPRTDSERRLAAIWCDILGLDRVGVTEDLFELGGHSLTATRIAARIQAEEQAAVSPVEVISTPTIEQLAALVAERRDGGRTATLPALTGTARRRAPLSRQQEQVWLHTALAPDSIAYHTQTTIRVVGPFDLDVFDRVITELGRRHAILRTTYTEAEDGLWQLVHEPGPVRADRIDLTDRPADERRAAAEELVEQELQRPFDLTSLPLLRWTVLVLADDEHELVLVEHHMVHDGWSFALLMRELKALYNAFARAEPSPLAEPSVQYADYAGWQHQQLALMDSAAADTATPGPGAADPVFAGQLEYWRKQLEGMPAPLSLLPDRPRPNVQTFRGDTLRIELPPQLPAAVRAFCRSHRLTLFSTMYAAFAALLHRYTGEQDVCIGSAYANRQLAATQEVVGMFVNAVVQRCEVTAELAFAELARRAQEVVFEAAQHQELPFVELVRALNPHRDAAVQPMAQILFSVNDSPLPELDLAGATGTVFERGNGSAKTDLDVVVIPRAESQTADSGQVDERILLLWEYNADLFDESTMRLMADRYLRLLAAAVAAPQTPVADLPLLTAAEEQRETEPAGEPLPALDLGRAVLRQAAARPDAVAVRSGAGQLTYRELADRARQLAGRLRRDGVGAGDVVAVLLPRGRQLVVAELAVLLAGAAFLPLEAGMPADRIAFCCADAGVRAAIGDPSGTLPPGTLPDGVPVLAVADTAAPDEAGFDPPASSGDDPAYVIYTSGSTGRPKGVLVSRAAMANLVGWHLEQFGLGPGDRAVLFASPAFDVSVGELWPALAAGASLHVPDEEVRLVPVRMRDWLAEHRITVADLPTTLAESLLALPEPPAGLRLLLTGGDRLTARRRPDTPYTVINAYGPTEATVTATWAEVGSGATLPDIGRPLPGVSAHVLDERMRPVPPGIAGELYLGGAGLALGYLNRPDLTAESFVPDPFGGSGTRLYRTGDRVRRTADGSLEFLGRTDAQIKLRGYRIEPGEIAAALRRVPGVAQAHVALVVPPGGMAQLVGYLVGTPGSAGAPEPAVAAAELRRQLGAGLPAYMVPAAYVWLDELPTTRSGKVDAGQLPAPQPAAESRGRPARGATESALAGIWRDVLGLDRVGTEDNFFDLGGHSLLLGRVHQRITAELRGDLPLITLFQYPTIGALARYLDSTGDSARNGAPAAAGPAPAARTEGRERLGRLRARR